MRKISVLIILLLVGTLFAQDSDKGVYDDTAKQIEKNIKEKDKVQIDDLKILHKGNSIYLEGIVDHYGSYYYAGKIAQDAEGIKSVDNEIVVRKKNLSDEEIQTNIFERVQRHLFQEPFDLVSVRVNHGFVTLSGSVRDSRVKQASFDEAIWVTGVVSVEDKIQLASISPADDGIRVALLRLLRRDFTRYFTGARPSVVILCEHGRVTLVGYVDSNADKQRMLSTARSLTGVISVEDQLQTN